MKTSIYLFFSVLSVVWGGNAMAACDPALKERTTSEVIEDLYYSIAVEDWDAVACNYRKKAFNIGDQGVQAGRDDIIASLQSLTVLFNGVDPVILVDDIFQDTAQIHFSMDNGWLEITHGVSTYVIRNGKINRQTTHIPITFNGPPPDPD